MTVKVHIDPGLLRELYVAQKKSIPEVSEQLGASRSTVRARLLELGVLRTRVEAVRVAATTGRLGNHARGTRRTFTAEWRANISAARFKFAAQHAKGVSLKPSGYYEHTRGENKGRSVHVCLMERFIGRRLRPDEVVHHIDHDRTNNDISNLRLMTRAEHTRLHRAEQLEAANGQR